MVRRGVLLTGIAVVGLLGAGCDDGSTDRAGASTLFDLETGQCFDSAATTVGRTVEIEDVTSVPCTGANDGEVFAVVTHPAGGDDPYPGDDSVADFAAAECLEQFPAYTGGGYDDSDLEVATVRPDANSWADRDDREVACVLYR
ncbi:MAG TPA: septum formation family protein, partial [Acidimicrobiia bacterium]|nr:septum formation family protein [Acidimicrobiia bacterium]